MNGPSTGILRGVPAMATVTAMLTNTTVLAIVLEGSMGCAEDDMTLVHGYRTLYMIVGKTDRPQHHKAMQMGGWWALNVPERLLFT